MATTLNSAAYRDYNLQILGETISGAFAGNTAFEGSILKTSGALLIDGSMPNVGPDVIGNTVTIPYFGTVGDFVDRAEGIDGVPNAIAKTNEQATVVCSYLGVSMTKWARYADLDDAYAEVAKQTVVAAQREIDRRVLAKAVTTELVTDLYSASSPRLLDYDAIVDARAMFGDENENVVAMAVHSRTWADLLKLKDTMGRPLVVAEGAAGDKISTFAGLPVIVSDRMPLTGSVMGAVTAAGTSPNVATLTGTPTGAWDLQIRVSGASLVLGTAKINFSTNGGKTWSGDITTGTAGVPVALIDPNKDPITGNNGTTGVSVAYAANFGNVNNTHSAKAIVKASSLIIKRGALAFWYNQNALTPQEDKNIRNDSVEIALHMYSAPHMYRRCAGGTKPGVVMVNHNVSGFTGP
jgi:hypothetical protein